MEAGLNIFKSAREYFTPVMTTSAFLDKGMLTPEEFVKAGDNLVRFCPSWQWQSGDPAKAKPYLPKDKQFLITRGVPCFHRVQSLQHTTNVDNMVNDGFGDTWCAPDILPVTDGDDDAVLVDDIDNMSIEKAPVASATVTSNNNNGKAVDDEYADMEDESLALDEAAVGTSNVSGIPEITAKPVTSTTPKELSVLRSRRYDVSITYDNYYKTPRIWLFGYDENGQQLTTNQIYQDIIQDYAKKTVTVDPHPHLSNSHASIHPCQHASAMLKIIQAQQAIGKSPQVEQYLYIFLKFIQSVVPTIEYDFTADVQIHESA